MIHMRTYSGYICTKQAFRHTFVTRIVSDDVRLVYCQHKVCSMQSSKPVSPGHFITSLSPLCVCWRRRSFSCVVSNTESVTSSSLSSSPTFGRLVFFSLQSGSCGLPNVCHRCIPSPIRHSCVSAGIVVPLFVSFVSVGLQVRHGACF